MPPEQKHASSVNEAICRRVSCSGRLSDFPNLFALDANGSLPKRISQLVTGMPKGTATHLSKCWQDQISSALVIGEIQQIDLAPGAHL